MKRVAVFSGFVLIALGGGTPAAPPPADPNAALAAHLAGWEAAMRQAHNFRADFTLGRKDAVFQKTRTYTGTVRCLKPNLAALRVESAANAADYEEYVCDGKAVY